MSVVVPTFNRVRRLTRVLDALATQSSQPSEIIVVSDGSTDGTSAYLRSLDPDRRVRTIEQENAGVSAARNAGAAAATGDLLLFVDDDLVPSRELVTAHVVAHLDGGPTTVVIGPMLDPEDHTFAPWTAWEQRMLHKQYDAMTRGDYAPTPRQFYTANASMRREFFARSGGFDPDFRRMEDIELAWRLGDLHASWVFEPDAIGWHYAERTFDSWIAIADAYGHNDVKFGRDQGRNHVLRTIVAEYGSRSILLRSLLQLTFRSDLLSSLVRTSARLMSSAPGRVATTRMTGAALSCAYNDAYYRGVIDELGGLRRFQDLMGWRR